MSVEKSMLDQLSIHGSVRVEALARKLLVTDETIRRLAKKLEAMGLVTKTHGAVHLREMGAEPSFAQRMQLQANQKRRIARAVAQMVTDGASLFLDVGSTTAYVAAALQIRRDLMVVTNSLAVATALTGRNGNQLFMAGGELRAHDGGAFGQEALDFVRQFRVTHAILSVAAIDEKDGFLLRDLREAEFSRAMMSRADQTTIAADATKYTTKAPIAIAPLTRFTRLVTDAAPPACVQAQLVNSGVTLTIV